MRSFRAAYLCATHIHQILVVSQTQYAGKGTRRKKNKIIRQNWHSIWVEWINYSYTVLFYMNLWNSLLLFFFFIIVHCVGKCYLAVGSWKRNDKPKVASEKRYDGRNLKQGIYIQKQFHNVLKAGWVISSVGDCKICFNEGPFKKIPAIIPQSIYRKSIQYSTPAQWLSVSILVHVHLFSFILLYDRSMKFYLR